MIPAQLLQEGGMDPGIYGGSGALLVTIASHEESMHYQAKSHFASSVNMCKHYINHAAPPAPRHQSAVSTCFQVNNNNNAAPGQLLFSS